MDSENMNTLKRYAVWKKLLQHKSSSDPSVTPSPEEIESIVCDTCSGCGCGAPEDTDLPEEDPLPKSSQ